MRTLTPEEIAAYDVLDPDLAAQVRIVRVPFLLSGASGMTLGRFVLLTSDEDRSGRRELVAHELIHVRQFAESGTIGFLRSYVVDYFRALRRLRRHRAAYLAIPAETDARREAAAWRARR